MTDIVEQQIIEENEASQAGRSDGMMRAVIYEDYGDANVLHLGEKPFPRRLPGQVTIQVKVSSVNPIDYRLRRGEMKGLLPGGFPRVPGYDVAGTIVDCDTDGPFNIGDRVFAFLDQTRGGAMAEYAVCAVDATAELPDDVSFSDAAAIPLAGTTALQSLRDHGEMKPNDRVLINGASGGVGMFAVQIAKAHGCTVDAVASARNEEFCRSLGADGFIDYKTENFLKSEKKWDLIFDVAGTANYLQARSVMTENSRYVSTEPDVKGMMTTLLTWPFSKSGKIMLARPCAKDLRELMRLHQAGNLKITIDSTFPLDRAADAHRRLESGVDQGKVIVMHT
ncbi:MAG: NAD(P)-dependent alcohol dehydrogenase [Pirellulaceae bacterium]